MPIAGGDPGAVAQPPPGRQRSWRPDGPVDLLRTVSPLRHGTGDPVARVVDGAFWWAARTPDGPATVRVSVRPAEGELTAQAWGPGAERLLAAAPDLVGGGDDWSGLHVGHHPILADVRRRFPGVRLPRTGQVLDSLVPACLEQRVTGQEARRAWRALVRHYGEPAPGPAEPQLWLAPDPAALLAVPSWDWHRFGVDGQRWRAIRAAATVASRLEECVAIAAEHGMAAVHQRLRVVPGIGEWTAAETSLRALGNPDAVSVGDFHVHNLVGYVLTGAARTDDDTMLELLEPWRGQRARVIRLVELSGLTPPKYGPRYSPADIRKI